MSGTISSARNGVPEQFHDAHENIPASDHSSSARPQPGAAFSQNSESPPGNVQNGVRLFHLPTGSRLPLTTDRKISNMVCGIGYNHTNEAALHHKLAGLYEHLMDGENSAEFHQMFEPIARELHAMGETPASIESTIAKGVNFNRAALVAKGGLRAMPFAAASLAFDHFPVLSSFAPHAAILGLDAGIQSAIADTFGCALLDRMTDDIVWMHAKPEEMHPLMQQAAEERKPSNLRLAGEYALAIQSYTARNLVRLGAAATVTALAGPKVAATVDSNISAGGGIVAGSVMGVTTYEMDRHKGRTGPEYMFARHDWKEQYLALKNATVMSGPVMGALKRTAKLPLDVMTDTPRALRALASAGGIGKTLALGGGFGGMLWARSAISTAMGSAHYSAASTAALSHLANVGGSALLYGSVPAVEILGDDIGDKLISTLQTDLPNALNGAAGWAAEQARKLLNAKLIKTS